MESQYQLIRELVEKHSGIDVKTRNRVRFISDCRFVYYKLCKDLIRGFTQDKCGKELGRGHATVSIGLKECNVVFNQSSFKAKSVYNDCLLDIKTNNLIPPPVGYYKQIIDKANEIIDDLFVEYELIKP